MLRGVAFGLRGFWVPPPSIPQRRSAQPPAPSVPLALDAVLDVEEATALASPMPRWSPANPLRRSAGYALVPGPCLGSVDRSMGILSGARSDIAVARRTPMDFETGRRSPPLIARTPTGTPGRCCVVRTATATHPFAWRDPPPTPRKDACAPFRTLRMGQRSSTPPRVGSTRRDTTDRGTEMRRLGRRSMVGGDGPAGRGQGMFEPPRDPRRSGVPWHPWSRIVGL